MVIPQSIDEELGGEPGINLQAEDETPTEEPQLASEEAKIVIAQLQARYFFFWFHMNIHTKLRLSKAI